MVDTNASFINPFQRTKSSIDRHIVGEPREELLLDNVFQRKASSLLHPYFYDIILFLVAGAHDPYPQVNIKSCEILEKLSRELIGGVKFFAVGLVRAVKHLLADRRAKVRLAALHAIHHLVACPNVDKCKGAGAEAIIDLIGHRDENVLSIADKKLHSKVIKIPTFVCGKSFIVSLLTGYLIVRIMNHV